MSDTATQILPLLGADGFSNVEPASIRDFLVILVSLMGAVYVGILLVERFKGKQTQARTIEGQPVKVEMNASSVSRSEFNALKEEVDEIKEGQKESRKEIIAVIKEGNKQLSDKIEGIAKAAYDGRQKIWEKVNRDGERIASVEAVQASKDCGTKPH